MDGKSRKMMESLVFQHEITTAIDNTQHPLFRDASSAVQILDKDHSLGVLYIASISAWYLFITSLRLTFRFVVRLPFSTLKSSVIKWKS
jgi:hypothetical protein